MSEPQDSINVQKKYDRTQEWNDAGFCGQGVNVWNMETIKADHGQTTTRRILDNAPDAKVHTYSHSMIFNGDGIKRDVVEVDGVEMPAADFVSKYGVNVCTKSVGGSTGIGKADSILYNGLKEKHKLAFFGSGGNDGSEGAGSSLAPDVAIWVGACYLYKGKELRMANYSGVGREGKFDIDFSDFTGVWTGTSFASPALAGKAALLKSRYGKDMSQEEIYKYFKFCTKDIKGTGYPEHGTYDVKSGYGLVIMPKIYQKYVTMKIGDKNIYVDGSMKQIDTEPIVINDRTFVPLRAISEALGAIVNWKFNDQEAVEITIDYRDDVVKLIEGKTTIWKNGKSKEIDCAPFVNDQDRTMVPIRAIVEILRGKVDWLEEERKVMFLEGE